MDTLGQRIRRLRQSDGLSQETLAFELGVTRQTVSAWETDVKQPTLDNICALSKFFKVEPEYFLLLCSNGTGEILIKDGRTDSCELDEVAVTEHKKCGKNICKKFLIVAAAIFISAVVALCITFGSIFLYLFTQPQKGDTQTVKYVFNWNEIAIAFAVFIAVNTIIALLIIIIKSKKTRKKSNPPESVQKPPDKK